MRTENPLRTVWYRQYHAWLEDRWPFLGEHNFREGLQGYPHVVNRSIPWTPWSRLEKPLEEARLALVSSCGAYIEGEHEPFDAHNPLGDATYCALPWAADRARLRLAHEHFNHEAADEDINSVLPLDRLPELAAARAVGELVEPFYTISGYALDAWAVKDGTAQEIADRLAEAGADAALLVPV